MIGSARRFMKMESLVKQYRELAKIPDVKSARIYNIQEEKDTFSVLVNWTCRDLVKMEQLSMYSVYSKVRDQIISGTSTPIGKIVLSALNENDGRTANIFKDSDKFHLSVSTLDGITSNIDLSAADVHDKVYTDGEFSCLEWSPDGTKLLYVAEKKKIKATNFFTQPKSDSKEEEDGRGKEFIYEDDWGEQLNQLHQSVVVIVDLTTEKLFSHCIGDGLCVGQLKWNPTGDGVIGHCLVAEPYRLGLIYCRNRQSFLFHMDLDGKFSEITSRGNYIQSPRFSPDGSKLIYMRSGMGGPHIRGAQLVLLSWPQKQETLVLDFVDAETHISDGNKFYGLDGSMRLSSRCWLNDNKHIVFSAKGPFNIDIYLLNTDTKELTCLTNYNNGSGILLDVYQNIIAFSYSSFTEPSRVFVAKVSISDKRLDFIMALTSEKTVNGVGIDWMDTWFDEPIPVEQDPRIKVPVLYVGPKTLPPGEKKRPLICFPHGGPHSGNSNMFIMSVAFYIKLGYSVIFINYRGSLGMGAKAIDSLPGFCGTKDVSDVYQATKSCLHRFSDVVDESRVVLNGGSHGGFLVTHLAGQYPDMYKAVSTRNPVTDIASMASSTDIPDWTFVESGFEFDHKSVARGDILSKMFDISPMKYIDHVKAPTLMLIGKNDRRVPPSQGIHYYKQLIARGIPSKMLVYDDCHSLSKVDVEADTVLNTALWFQKYID